MSICSLKDTCFRIVLREIWSNSNVPEELTKLSVTYVEVRKTYMSEYADIMLEEVKPSYYLEVESTLKKIMALETVPHKLKIKIALAFIHFEKEVMDFILNLIKGYCLRSKENILYSIKKVIIQSDCKLGRRGTILKILNDSYLEVNLIGHDTVKYSAIRPFMLENVLEDLVVSHKKEARQKIYNMINILRESNLFQVWKQEASLARDGNYEFKANKIQALEYVAANAPLEVLTFFHLRLTKKYRKLLLPSMAVFAILSTKDTEDNIIFLYEKLPSCMWLKIMIRYHDKIFTKIFLSYYSGYCLNFYQQMCKHNEVEICKTLICKSLELLCLATCKYDYTSIAYSNSKDTFLLMWYNTPDLIKLGMGNKIYEMLDILIQKNDFHLLFILINDIAFNEKQKFDYTLHVVSRVIMEPNKIKLDDFIKEGSGACVSDIKENININVAKKMILKKSYFSCDYEALSIFFGSKAFDDTLKHELIKDQTFMMEALIVISQREKGEENVASFLKWIFGNDETAIENFVQKHLIGELWLVDIYKRYLLECSNEYCYPTPFLFTCLNVNPETVDNIKCLVRNDKQLIFQLCDNFMSPRLHKAYKLFDCIFNKNEEKEKECLQSEYLLSDRGMSRLYKLFESDFFNEDLYMAYGFHAKVKHYFKIEKHWIDDCYILQDKINDKFEKWGHPNTLNRLSDFDKRISLLPSEKVEINRVIVDANYRMFRSIVYDHYSKYRVLTDIEEGIKRTLTEYTEYYAMRYITTVPFVP